MMNALVDIFAIAAVSVTAIVLVSLRFVAVLDEREREERDDRDGGAVRLEPFQIINKGSVCLKCGATWRSERDSHNRLINAGPRISGACYDKKCGAARLPHLHVSCNTCDSRWFMATKDAPPPPQPTDGAP